MANAKTTGRDPRLTSAPAATAPAVDPALLQAFAAFMAQQGEAAPAAKAPAAAKAVKTADPAAEVQKALGSAKYLETRYSEKGHKPYAVVAITGPSGREQKLTIWL